MSKVKPIEEKLMNYFNKDKKINGLNKKLEILRRQITEIDNKLQNIDVDLPEESLSINYEDKVQTNPSECGYAEKALIKITDRLLYEKAYREEEIIDIEETLRNMEFDNLVIDDAVSDLGKQDYEFLKQKYRYGKRDWQLGMMFNISQPAATDRKNKLVKNIINFCN